MQNLYSKGARRFLVAGLPPVGCLPLQITVRNIIPNPGMLERACVMDQNHDCRSYNNKLQAIVSNLNSRLEGVKVNYGDVYTPLMDMVRNPSKYGELMISDPNFHQRCLYLVKGLAFTFTDRKLLSVK